MTTKMAKGRDDFCRTWPAAVVDTKEVEVLVFEEEILSRKLTKHSLPQVGHIRLSRIRTTKSSSTVIERSRRYCSYA